MNYEGGGQQSEKMNVIFADLLCSQKVRVKLIVLSAAGMSRKEITAAFCNNRLSKCSI